MVCHLAFGQTEAHVFKEKELKMENVLATELKVQLIKYNFSSLFTITDNSEVYGFIGDNYEQRIRVKIIKVTKQPSSSDTYDVYGKSMVKNNIDEFHGIMKISNIRKRNITEHGCENENTYKGFKGQYVILGDYTFYENKHQTHTGVFNGSFRSFFFINKNDHIKYDDIEFCSDSYNNNQFVGQWAQYNGNITKRCNWGDYRIPSSGHFDIGAGDFSPGGYKSSGWETLNAKYRNDKKGQAVEEAKWWK